MADSIDKLLNIIDDRCEKNINKKSANYIKQRIGKVIEYDSDNRKAYVVFPEDEKEQIHTYYNKTAEYLEEGNQVKIFYTTNIDKGWVGLKLGEPQIITVDAGVGKPSDWDNTSEYFNSYTGDNKNIAGTKGEKNYYATARGYGTQATGTFSSAEGWLTTANGGASHAEGYQTTASEWYAHSEGQYTTASALCAHAEGYETTASGSYSHAEGYETTASGGYSHVEGFYSTASGDYCHAEGRSVSSGTCSHSEGQSTSKAWCSHAEGQASIANNYTAHAEGFETEANGYAAHSEGHNTIANGYAAHSEGYKSKTDENSTYCHAEGYQTTAGGNSSHSEGIETVAQNSASHAEGNKTIANGYACHAEGDNTQSIGQISHAEGSGSIANGYACHAEGDRTTAQGFCCYAGGQLSSAYGNSTFVHGSSLQLSSSDLLGRAAFGRYNDDSNTNLIFQIGNGNFVDGKEQRHNAFAVDNDGNIYCNSVNDISGNNIIKTYESSNETSTVDISVDNINNKISASVNISKDNDNALSVGEDGGLYAKKNVVNTYATGIKFTATGFDLTFSDGEKSYVNSFVVSEDANGNITKISNSSTGRDIDITYE